MVYIFNIEGNIGSGKSTLVRILEKEIKCINSIPIIYVQEPVDEWTTTKKYFSIYSVHPITELWC